MVLRMKIVNIFGVHRKIRLTFREILKNQYIVGDYLKRGGGLDSLLS